MSTPTPSDVSMVAGRYRLDRVLGAGGAAVVHEACDIDTGERVAVKVYRPDGSGRLTQQHRELTALAELRHPGLVALRGGGTEPGPDGRTYVVTDLVDGPSLAKRLHAGPLDAEEVQGLAVALADALAHVHAHGFVHRDIKPANILMEHGHQPRLADFGIARALDGTVVTATGTVAGTAAYLAPEQVRGETVDTSADVYALGLVLLEALTGHLEYPGTLVESATARLHRRPVVPDGLPRPLATVLAAMTELDPAARPTAAAVISALTEPEVAAPGPGWQRFAQGAPTALAAAALLAALLGGIVLFLNGSRASTQAVPVPSIDAPVAAPVERPPSTAPQVAAAPLLQAPVAAPVVARAAVAPAAAAAADDPVAPPAAAVRDDDQAAPAPAKPAPKVTEKSAAENEGKGKGNGGAKGNTGNGNSGKGNNNGNGNGNAQGADDDSD